LLRSSSPAALVDGENRVVVSTVPELETGVRLSAVGSWTVEEHVAVVEFGWSLVLMTP